MKLSIVAPTYKVDKYLNDFIRSLRFLDFIDYEVIFVNDDPSKKLRVSGKNIKIINNEKNQGLLMSRYIGFKNISSNSTHITFIDPDDRLSGGEFLGKIGNNIINFSYNEWYENKKVRVLPNGSVGPQGLDNHIWGIVFPVKILSKYASLLSNNNLSDDFPIKEVIARENVILKSETVMIDYRMRKSSLSKTKFSFTQANKEIYSWNWLGDKYSDNQYKARANEELHIRKKSFTKEQFNEWKEKIGYKRSFNGTMYRITKFGLIKRKIKNMFTNKKMFE